jgi:hypothetical protein
MGKHPSLKVGENMLPDTRDLHGMGYGSHPYGMGYSPYPMGHEYYPYEMSGHHSPYHHGHHYPYHHDHYHHHGHHHPYHDGVMQSQSVLINVPHMMHGMKHRFL